MSSNKNLIIIYLAAAGDGISGGTRIHIECTKQWLKNNSFESIAILASNDGYKTCLKNGIDKKCLVLMNTSFTKKLSFWLDYYWRIIKGIWLSSFYKLNKNKDYYLYAASDSWADFFPALILKIRHKNNTKLVTPIYLFVPKPLTGYDGKFIFNIKLLVYYFMQQIMMFFARKYSDAIFVTYSPDLSRLKKLNFKKQSRFVIVGGIEFDKTTPYVRKKKYQYDAVFVGRYHPQKGIYQLLEVWKNVVQKKARAKLALLGNGNNKFETYIKDFIKNNNLSNNIFLLGFMDGAKKYNLFAKTKIYLNTNLYDAGGMATMEAMSCALPVVSFDFPNSRSMIGDGVLWAKYLDTMDFSQQILRFLNNNKLIKEYGVKARRDMKKFDWSTTANRILNYFESLN